MYPTRAVTVVSTVTEENAWKIRNRASKPPRATRGGEERGVGGNVEEEEEEEEPEEEKD
jgi:hypothetical protein